MNFFGWFLKRQTRKSSRVLKAESAREAGITARVDMIRYEALAEARFDALFETRPAAAKHRFEEARRFFDGAIEAARLARLPHEVARLTRRRDQVVRIFNNQFRYLSDR